MFPAIAAAILLTILTFGNPLSATSAGLYGAGNHGNGTSTR
jgi:hypothetical protein